MIGEVRKHFGDWPRGADPFATDPIPPVPPLTRNVGVVVEQPVNTVIAEVQWGGPGAHADPAATYAADVFSDVLNQPGSRFQRKLVDSGLWQSLGVNYYTLNHVGPITISATTAMTTRWPQLTSIMLAQLPGAQTLPLRGPVRRAAQSRSHRCRTSAGLTAFGLRPDRFGLLMVKRPNRLRLLDRLGGCLLVV